MALPIQIPGLDNESHRFPHTRAQLQATARHYELDADIDNQLVATVAALLTDENEDELKRLLKATYPGINDDMVRLGRIYSPLALLIVGNRSSRMSSSSCTSTVTTLQVSPFSF